MCDMVKYEKYTREVCGKVWFFFFWGGQPPISRQFLPAVHCSYVAAVTRYVGISYEFSDNVMGIPLRTATINRN